MTLESNWSRITLRVETLGVQPIKTLSVVGSGMAFLFSLFIIECGAGDLARLRTCSHALYSSNTDNYSRLLVILSVIIAYKTVYSKFT